MTKNTYETFFCLQGECHFKGELHSPLCHPLLPFIHRLSSLHRVHVKLNLQAAIAALRL